MVNKPKDSNMYDLIKKKVSNKKLVPIFGRVGSKTMLKNKILKIMPKEYNLYVEPFVGGGSVFLNIPLTTKSVINDKDTELINFWKLVKKGITGNAEYYDSHNLYQLRKWYNLKPKSDMGRLTNYILKTKNTFASTGKGKLYKSSNPYDKLKKLDDFKEKLKYTTITNSDYRTIMKKYDNPKTFFYLDPPYSKTGTKKGDYASSDLYKEGYFKVEDLSNFLKTIKGKWLLSLEDSSRIRNFFKGYKIRSIITGGTANLGVGAKKRKEVLISNY